MWASWSQLGFLKISQSLFTRLFLSMLLIKFEIDPRLKFFVEFPKFYRVANFKCSAFACLQWIRFVIVKILNTHQKQFDGFDLNHVLVSEQEKSICNEFFLLILLLDAFYEFLGLQVIQMSHYFDELVSVKVLLFLKVELLEATTKLRFQFRNEHLLPPFFAFSPLFDLLTARGPLLASHIPLTLWHFQVSASDLLNVFGIHCASRSKSALRVFWESPKRWLGNLILVCIAGLYFLRLAELLILN